MKKFSFIFLCLLMFTFVLFAQNSPFLVPDSVISLSAHQQINFQDKLFGMPLWDELPDSLIIHTIPEWIENRPGNQNQFGFNRAIHNVQTPSLLFFPAGVDTLHPAVVIFPGGAFERVTIDKEGIDVAQRFNQSGISAIIVKYRTSPIEYPLNDLPDSISATIQSDARQALKVVREKASEYNIDPVKIGVMGFAVGGAMAANLAVDKTSSPTDYDPDFACLTYPILPDTTRTKVSVYSPPTFLASTLDNNVAPPTYVEELYDSLIANGVEAEIQLSDSGGHGYGLGINDGEVSQWPGLFVDWLEMNNILITGLENRNAAQNILPNKFILNDSYPNPFNPSTTISYQLNTTGFVKLKIFDSNGREVQTLVNKKQQLGYYEIEWNANNRASGVYFLNLTLGNQSKSRRLVLIK